MALQYGSPLVFGVMLVVAVGTIAYSWWNSKNRQEKYSNSSSKNSFPYGYDTIPVQSITDGERKHRRRTVEQCSICLEGLRTNVTTLPCCHAFHKKCIDEWFLNQQTCPNCRKTSNTTI